MPNQYFAENLDSTGSIRSFSSALPSSVLGNIQTGVLRTTYRGVLFLKSPFDVIIYLQLIQQLRPQTVIEIGTKKGGSALWFADMLTLHGIKPQIISVDINPQTEVSDSRIRFLQGDAFKLGEVLKDDLLLTLAHPFLVIEDSAHFYETTLSTLEFFDPYLQSGDYIVIEDGIVADMPDSQYAVYESGPNRAVTKFMETTENRYTIDTALCDYFGYNYTYNPNGYLRRN